MDAFEERAQQAEERLARLEAFLADGGGKGQSDESAQLRYRIEFLKRALDARDERIGELEAQLASK